MSTLSRTLRVIAAALALALVACPRAQVTLEPPYVMVRGVETQAGDDGAPLILRASFAIENPNRHVAFEVTAIDWELTIDDVPFARGRIDEPGSLPACATSACAAWPLDVELLVPAGAATRVRSALAGGGQARVTGLVHVAGAAGTSAATFGWPTLTP